MIRVTQGFQPLTREAIDNRIVLTKADMLNVNDNQMPDTYFAICKEDGYIYIYDKSVRANGETGKFNIYNPSSIRNITIDGSLLPVDNFTVDIPLFVLNGYYHDGQFYKDSDYKEKYVGYTWKMYIDIPTSMVYMYTGFEYKTVSVPIPTASSDMAGIAKLYSSLGDNSDGSVDQNTVTSEINKRIKAKLGEDETLILFTQ